MGGLDAHVRARFNGGDGQFFIEFQMGAVGLVNQKDFSAGVANLRDFDQVGGDAVIGRAGDENGLGLGKPAERVFDLVRAGIEEDVQVLVHLGLDPYRPDAG